VARGDRFEAVHVPGERLEATVRPRPDGALEVAISLRDEVAPRSLLHWGVIRDGVWTVPPSRHWPGGSVGYAGEGDGVEAIRTRFSASGEDAHTVTIELPPQPAAEGIGFVIYDPVRGYDNNAGRDYRVPLDETRLIRAEDSGRSIAVEAIEFAPPTPEQLVYPHFPLTLTVRLRETRRQLAGGSRELGLPEAWRWQASGLGEFIEPAGRRCLVRLDHVERDDDGMVLKGIFVPSISGPHRYRVLLDVGGRLFCLRAGEWPVAEPIDFATWTHGPMITEIDPGLFIGNAAAAANPAVPAGARIGLLEGLGIRAVLNAAEERDTSPALRGSWIEYHSIPFTDSISIPLGEEKVREALRWVDERLKAGKPVLVHCHAGIGRSGSLIVAYLSLFVHPEMDRDEIVALVNERLRHKQHRINTHVGLEETIESLRREASEGRPRPAGKLFP